MQLHGKNGCGEEAERAEAKSGRHHMQQKSNLKFDLYLSMRSVGLSYLRTLAKEQKATKALATELQDKHKGNKDFEWMR